MSRSHLIRAGLLLLGALAAAPAVADPVTPFHFDGDTAPTGLKDHTEYLIDPDGEETLDTVRQRDDWRPVPRAILGYIARPVWSRTTLVNTSDEGRPIILYKLRPGVARVDAHFIHSDGSRTHHLLGSLRPHEEQSLWHRYVTVSETLEAGERITLYTRVHTPGPLEATWWFSSVGDFSTHSTIEHLVWGLFAGAVLTMVLYNLMLWFSLRERILLVYAVFGVLLLLVGYTAQGFYRLFDFGLPHIWHVYGSWFFGTLLYAAMIVFGIVFFDTRRTMPRMHRWLQFLLAICVFYLVWQVVATQHWEWFALSPWMYHLFIATYISLMATAFLGFRLGLVGSGYYLAGQGSIFIATLLGSLALTGHITHSLASLLFLPVGGVLDVAFLSKAISLRIGLLKAELERQRESTVAQSRFASIGKTVGMVTHQWRTPLA
ncbi:MAG: 7TMR-DISM family protein, partial [Pseudomonadota bacterium]